MVLIMVDSLKEYYESRAAANEEARLDEGMSSVLSKIEEVGLDDIVEWDSEE
jgi:hypothetical protein